jgi:hypothetical protein
MWFVMGLAINVVVDVAVGNVVVVDGVDALVVVKSVVVGYMVVAWRNSHEIEILEYYYYYSGREPDNCYYCLLIMRDMLITVVYYSVDDYCWNDVLYCNG